MKYCLNTSTIKPQALLDKIRLAGEAGYDGIELWLNDVLEHVARGGIGSPGRDVGREHAVQDVE